MISNLSAASTAPEVQAAPTKTQAPAPTAAPAKQDSVKLSPQAQAAAKGDVDHDGDSH
jgi:hypothetical protein